MSVRSPLRVHERSAFYKYVTADVAKLIVATRKLRWSSPVLFNDPFDVPREADLGFTSEDLYAAIVHEFIRLIGTDEIPNNPTIALLLALLRHDERPGAREAVVDSLREMLAEKVDVGSRWIGEFHRVWAEFVPNLRILCLSESNDSAPMWAHYAGSSRGAVLRFSALDEVDSSLLLARPVIYQDTAPRLPGPEVWARSIIGLGAIDWMDFFKEYHYVKSMEWSPEREWRVISNTRAGERGLYYDMGFQPPDLAAIYLGAEMSASDADSIVSALKGDLSHVEVHRARVDQTERRIVFDRER